METNFPSAPEPLIASFADLWNPENPRSVVNMVPDSLRNKFDDAYKKHPDLFGLDEKSLHKKLRSNEETPSPTDNRIRLKFWYEYDTAQVANRKMNMSAVLAGVCSRQFFEDHYVKHPGKVAWLLTPPASYGTIAEEALAFGMEQLRDMLEIPHVDSHGKPNTKMMEIKAKIVMMLDLRVKGGITQRIEQKNLGLTIHTTDKAIANLAQQGSMEQIDKRIKELEARERKALNMPQAPIGDSSDS